MGALRRVVASALVVALAAIPAVCGFSGCASRSITGGSTGEPLPDLRDAGLKSVWQRQVGLDSGETLKKAWRVGRSVYVTSSASRIARVDIQTGALAWSESLGGTNSEIYKPIELTEANGGAGMVLVATRGEAFVMNMNSGDVASSAHLGIGVSTDPVLIDNILCIGGANYFEGLYLDRFRRCWTVPSPNDLFDSAPAASEDTLVIASRSGRLWRVHADTGDWRWKDRKTNGAVVAGLAADTRAVYVPALDQRVYAFGLESGTALWDAQLEGTLDQTPAMGGSVVMVPSRGRGLYALNRQNGDQKWFASGVTQVGTVVDDHVWVGDEAGNLKSLDLETGQVRSSSRIPGVQFVVRNRSDDQVIVVTHSGVVGLYAPNK